ncbi:MAG: endo-arabinase [Bacteroidota bacterium]|nr:endo-arabinase [Bacteroidota bacterium]
MKWTITFCLLLISAFGQSQSYNDSAAIVKLLEKAAVTFRSGDAKAYADCWKIEPYSIIFISTADGKALSIPAEALAKPSSSMGQGGFATATNYRMSIHGDNGWTSFDEVSTSKEGTKTYSYEVWMVEKINGEWKLVAASMHFYKQP